MQNHLPMASRHLVQLAGITASLLLLDPAAANSWQTVHASGSEKVAIDRGSIVGAVIGGGVTAWSRIELERAVAAVGGNYDTIRAQNFYDCDQRRFTTLRRAYFLGETQVHEDAVARRRANAVQVGSLDEKLLSIACQQGHANTAAADRDRVRINREDTVPVETADRPAAMHADLRKMGDGDVARTYPVADSGATEKPKLIQLPAIDKAALAQAAAALEATQRGSQETPTKGQGAKAAAASPAKSAAPAKSDAREIEALSEKRIRELHYANSGPPRTARKKAPASTASHPDVENPAASMHGHWSYEGEAGPAHWAKLRPDYAACASGKRQSPIDIRDGVRVNLENIRFDYKPMQFRIVDNGHTVQVNLGEGSSLTVMGKRYALQQFHFHRPSEEKVNGRSYDMSVHLVHRNDEGQLAVVAVLLEKGAEHPLIQTLLNNLPLEQNMELSPEEAVDPSRLLPENRSYWTFMGSLTTPPCTEGVLWMVMKQPLQVAAEQIAIFSKVFRANSRPVQALNGRLIKETR